LEFSWAYQTEMISIKSVKRDEIRVLNEDGVFMIDMGVIKLPLRSIKVKSQGSDYMIEHYMFSKQGVNINLNEINP